MKLRARDSEDLAVLSAMLQDALVAVRDMAWLPREKRFVMIANRFRWEAAPEPFSAEADEEAVDASRDADFADTPDEVYSRIFAGLCIERVQQAQVRGIDLKQQDRLLELLALEAEEGALRLIFAEGAEIRLRAPRISIHMEDLGEAWPTHWRPKHAAEEES